MPLCLGFLGFLRWGLGLGLGCGCGCGLDFFLWFAYAPLGFSLVVLVFSGVFSGFFADVLFLFLLVVCVWVCVWVGVVARGVCFGFGVVFVAVFVFFRLVVVHLVRGVCGLGVCFLVCVVLFLFLGFLVFVWVLYLPIYFFHFLW